MPRPVQYGRLPVFPKEGRPSVLYRTLFNYQDIDPTDMRNTVLERKLKIRTE